MQYTALAIEALLYLMILSTLSLILYSAWRAHAGQDPVGLRWLEVVAQISPFVGLAGTVWSVMHALSGAATLDFASLAPVLGQALMATFLGIVAAIPAAGAVIYFRQD